MHLRFKSAFSLLELLVVLVIVGIVLAIGVPGINKARADAELETMRSRAVALQTAKLSFIDAVGSAGATTQWANQGSDTNRYQNLLRPYLPNTYTGTLGDLFPPTSPFSVNLGAAISDSVTLQGPDPANPNSNINIPLQKY